MSGSPRQRQELPVAEVCELTTRYGDNLVHDRISISVRRGEILAIVGGSGSGKSTLMRRMVLLEEVQQGSVHLFGQDVTGLSATEAPWLLRRLGVLFQNNALFGAVTVLENVGAPLREHTGLSEATINEIAALKIALTGLETEASMLFPSQLSGGMRKRAALARAIALDPELLFLDEPTSGLDPISADGFDELVLRLKDSLGLTVVMITHDMDSLWRVADRVVLLGEGKVLGEGEAQDLARSEIASIQKFFQGPRGRAAQAQVRT